MKRTGRRAAVPPYGTPIQDAIAKGNLQEMKALARRAEIYLAQMGDLPTALTALKAEIAKRERKS